MSGATKRGSGTKAGRDAAAAEPTTGQRIIASLREGLALLESPGEPGRKITVRIYGLRPGPPEFTPDRVVLLRERLGVSQAVFANLLGVSRAAVRSWEQATRPPSRTACRLMQTIEFDPERWLAWLVDQP
jgi:putative transcriptional regulator